jgi:hypothetical protein
VSRVDGADQAVGLVVEAGAEQQVPVPPVVAVPTCRAHRPSIVMGMWCWSRSVPSNLPENSPYGVDPAVAEVTHQQLAAERAEPLAVPPRVPTGSRGRHGNQPLHQEARRR